MVPERPWVEYMSSVYRPIQADRTRADASSANPGAWETIADIEFVDAGSKPVARSLVSASACFDHASEKAASTTPENRSRTATIFWTGYRLPFHILPAAIVVTGPAERRIM